MTSDFEDPELELGGEGGSETEPYDSDSPDAIKAKIVFTLKHYPCISGSMLQVGIGPKVRPALWRPLLDDLILKGYVQRETVGDISPSGRYINIMKVSLTHAGIISGYRDIVRPVLERSGALNSDREPAVNLED